MLQKRELRAAKMERWTVYAMTLQFLTAIARATEDFRHISYEGKKLLENDEDIYIDIHFNISVPCYCRRSCLLFVIFELYLREFCNHTRREEFLSH